MTDRSGARGAVSGDPAGRYRWAICALLFAATAINYVDRQMIGVLKPTLQKDLGWSETAYADIVFWFQAAYAIGYLSFGRIIDRLGARIGYAVTFTIWTLSHMAHGLVGNVTQFALARFSLGLGESGSFPASLKAVSEWFPQKERALAVGLFNAGANVGAILTPLIVPAITLAWGWRMAFFITGGVSLIWLAAWLGLYRRPERHKRVTPAELAYIRQDAPAAEGEKASFGRILLTRETWAYALVKFLTDPVWWLYLFWLPDFLHKTYGLDLKSFGPPLVAVYVLSDIGSVLGGWGSSRLVAKGVSVNRARKTAMFICALLVLPIVFAQFVSHLWLAVLIVGVAAAAHQAYSANLMTLPSDLFPRAAVGTVVGIGGTAGAVGGMLMSTYSGYILETFHSYQPIFVIAGGAYLLGFAILHILSPRLTRVRPESVT